MNKNIRYLVTGALIAALYVALFYAQNLLVPSSATMAVQFRVAEALNILALFTPAAIPGLTIGCILSNVASIGQGLPLDMIFGSLATLGATVCIWLLRKVKIKGYPLFAMLMPAVWNGAIIGWEIEQFFIEGPFTLVGFLVQGGLVALGELVVMLVLGSLLYWVIVSRHLEQKLFRPD